MLKTKIKIPEDELLLLLKNNSEMAFNYLYDNYSSALYGIIKNIVIDPDRSKDVLQDTFIKIWKNKASYDSIKGTFFTWMLNIARNSAIDSNRSKHVKYKIQFEERIVDQVNKLDGNLKIETIGLKETILKLRPEYQEILNYVYLQGYTQQDFSDNFNIPLGTVKTRTRAALSELRTLLRENL